MKSLFYLVVTMIVVIACTNEEFDANSEVKKEEAKTKIASLAKKYDVNVDFFEINPSEKTENEMSLDEIEELFRDIKQLREQPVEISICKNKEENGCVFYSTPKQDVNRQLVKTRSEIYTIDSWEYNLTWFTVTLIENAGDVSVSTAFTGVGFYSYSQSNASASVSDNMITFRTTGTAVMTIAHHVGVNVSVVVNSSGSYNKSTGKGNVSVTYI
ncbi:hypothetical protein [Bacteroides caecimuris]|uniref:hypothetical protein n=1 Tax=Bacteroides caecimuris TaxID=1796613 RepID=UPI002573769C|nr:hypothetical protein [Bacteroides caecimuris]